MITESANIDKLDKRKQKDLKIEVNNVMEEKDSPKSVYM